MRDEHKVDLTRLLAEIDGQLATLPKFTWETRSEHTHALARLVGKLERSEQARFGEAAGGATTVDLAGVRSSSVMGAEFALRNWVKTARSQLSMGAAS